MFASRRRRHFRFFLQSNLFAFKNIVISKKDIPCLTDAYSMIKMMFQVFERHDFVIIANAVANESEALGFFSHINLICKNFLGFDLHFTGHILSDYLVSQSIVMQKIAVLAATHSEIANNFSRISSKIRTWQVIRMGFGLSYILLDSHT